MDRRDQILAAALGAFAEKGFAAATIEDVRERSGASTGSIYHHFGDKEGLAAAPLRGRAARLPGGLPGPPAARARRRAGGEGRSSATT